MFNKIPKVNYTLVPVRALIAWVGLLLIPGTLFAQTKAVPSVPIRVAILICDGVYDTELIAPLDVFNRAGSHTRGQIRVFTVAPGTGPVATAERLHIVPQYSFANAPGIDWLVVPSGTHYRTDLNNRILVGWIRTVGRRSKVVHSNCWGAFLLGAAGLLDGREVTTFPASLDEFVQRFPRAVEPLRVGVICSGQAPLTRPHFSRFSCTNSTDA